ncbi:MAG: hypothetical protein IKL73_03925, partial [Lachnospiraceae bacterium]|nr:hypothetical protein [Lachnospiraceae bacterium]
VNRYGNISYDSILTMKELEEREDFQKYLNEIYKDVTPQKLEVWISEKRQLFEGTRGDALEIFEELIASNDWINISTKYNNVQKPIQNLRKLGLCILTHRLIEEKETVYRLIFGIDTMKRESEKIPPNVRSRVLRYYEYIDALTGEKKNESELVVEHKFPEERWADRPVEDNRNLTDEMIEQKFQLLTTQYNMVKREACKKCVEFAERQAPFNINFFYEGDENWNCDIELGVQAEAGCIGCGWYDMKKWKESLIRAANRENFVEGEEDDE